MRMTPLESKISKIAEPVVQDLGLSLVCVKVLSENGAQNVQIMAENPETRRLGIDDCTKLSKAIAAVMDVEDPINGAYRLEVSSPGIDRPLLKLEDFESYKGFEVKLETDTPIDVVTGQKRFRGRIKGTEGEVIKISTDQGPAEIPFGLIAKAKLVLTDELIKATANS